MILGVFAQHDSAISFENSSLSPLGRRAHGNKANEIISRKERKGLTAGERWDDFAAKPLWHGRATTREWERSGGDGGHRRATLLKIVKMQIVCGFSKFLYKVAQINFFSQIHCLTWK